MKIFSQDHSNKAKLETFPLLTQVYMYVKSPHYALLLCLQMCTLICMFTLKTILIRMKFANILSLTLVYRAVTKYVTLKNTVEYKI